MLFDLKHLFYTNNDAIIKDVFLNIIREYEGYNVEKERGGYIQFSENNRKSRHAQLCINSSSKWYGVYTNFKDGGKGYNIVSFLKEKRGMTYAEIAQFIAEELGLTNASEYQFNKFDENTYKLAQQEKYRKQKAQEEQEKREAIARKATEYAHLTNIKDTRAETYIKHTRALKNLPESFTDCLKYDQQQKAIVYPISTPEGHVVNCQRVFLDEKGEKANPIKYMDKGGKFKGGFWYITHPDNTHVIEAEGVETLASIVNAINIYDPSLLSRINFVARMGTAGVKLTDKTKVVIVAIDHDAPDSPAYKATWKNIDEKKQQGLTVIPWHAQTNTNYDKSDFNDIDPLTIYASLTATIALYKERTGAKFNALPTVEFARQSLTEQLKNILQDEKNALVKVTMGLGKTTTTVDLLANLFLQGSKKRIGFFFPNHKLAQETYERLQTLLKDYPNAVGYLKGRQQPNMCNMLPTVQQYINAGISVAQHLCKDACPLKTACNYLKNIQQLKEAKIIVGTHESLISAPMQEIGTVDTIIIDEYAQGQTFENNFTIHPNTWKLDLTPFQHWGEYNGSSFEKLKKASSLINVIKGVIISDNTHTKRTSWNATEFNDMLRRCLYSRHYSDLQPTQNKIIALHGEIHATENALKEAEELLAKDKINLAKLTPKQHKNYKIIIENRAIDKKKLAHLQQELETYSYTFHELDEGKTALFRNINDTIQYIETIGREAYGALSKKREFVEQYQTQYKAIHTLYKITNILKQQLQQQDNAGSFYLNSDGTIDVKTFNKINKTWGHKNTIILDATPADTCYKNALGNNPTTVEIMEVKKNHANITQYIGTGFSKSNIQTAINNYNNTQGDLYTKLHRKGQAYTSIYDIISFMWTQYDTQKEIQQQKGINVDTYTMGAIMPKCLYDFINEHSELNFPPVKKLYFGIERGHNEFKDVNALLILGHALPEAEHFIRQHETLTGEHIHHKQRNYTINTTILNDTKGKEIQFKHISHPNPQIKKLIHIYTQSQLLQAIERARTANRTDNNPVEIVIATATPLYDIPINNLNYTRKNDLYSHQYYNAQFTHGQPSLIVEGKNIAKKIHGERLLTPQSYTEKTRHGFTTSDLVKKLVTIHKWKTWRVSFKTDQNKKITHTNIIAPPQWYEWRIEDEFTRTYTENTGEIFTHIETQPAQLHTTQHPKTEREKEKIKENNPYISIITPAQPVFDNSQVKKLFTRSYNTPDPVKFTTLENRGRLKIEENDFLEWTNVVNYVKEQVTHAQAQARA